MRMDARLRTGTFWSGVGHAGAVLWVLLGDWLFVPHPEVEVNATQVSMITGAEFAALMASAPAPSIPSAPEQSPNPPARPETVPAPTAPEAAPPESESAPAVEAPAPEVPPPADVALPPEEPSPPEEVAPAPVEQPLPSMTSSLAPRPRPAERIAPAPEEIPESAPAETPRPAISDDVAEDVPPEPEVEAAPEDAGDILRTEATEEQDQALGMTSSPAPRARPADLARRAAEAAVAATPEAPAPGDTPAESVTSPVAEDDAIAAAIAAATASASESAVSQPSAGASVSGPPLNAGEIGDIRAAIAGKWNLGSVSSEVLQTVIVVRVEFGPDGKPGAITLVERDGPSASAIDVAFSAARRAIQRAYVEGGIPLPPDKYDTWKVMEFVFDANGMRMR